MKQTMQIFAAVGPLGAGKTTLTLNTILSLIKSGVTTEDKCAFILNEEGGMLDGELVGNLVKVIPMVNGCFTCSDESDTRKKLQELDHLGMEWVFLEGFGITSGMETKKFLESCPYPFRIVCVLDFKHHKQNLEKYSDVVRSHVQAATVGIGITKYGSVTDLADLDKENGIAEYISANSSGKNVFLIDEGGTVPQELLSGSLGVKGSRYKCLPIAKGSPLHPHKHGHKGIHNMMPKYFRLRSDASFQEVKDAFEGSQKEILRIKGAVEGKLFNWVWGDWKQTFPDKRTFVTFYNQGEVVLSRDYPKLAELILPAEEASTAEKKSYELMRVDTLSRSEAVEEIKKLMGKVEWLHLQGGVYVTHTRNNHRLITHPEELQILKEMARRPSLKDECFVPALKVCVDYWLYVGQLIRQSGGHFRQEELATNKREIGISLTWWVTKFGQMFGDKLVTNVKELKPAEMVAEGALDLKSLNSDPERAYWQCQEIVCALRFGLKNVEDGKLIKMAFQHCLHLASGTRVESEWKSIAKEFI